MSFRNWILCIWIVGSCLLGWLLQPIEVRLRANRSKEPQLAELDSLMPALGHGVSVAALGGYRNLTANLVWINMYRHWERLERDETLRQMNLAVALNPNSEFFWLDGARIIANDMPTWEVGIESADVLDNTPEGIQIRYRYARMALEYLEGAPSWLSHEESILTERGLICWRKLDDLDAALGYFSQIALGEDAPYHLSRVYAELLVKNGQIEEAYRFLSEHLKTLPDDDLTAMKPLVEKRVAELAALLKSNQ